MEKISEDKLERLMERTMHVSQFVMACIMFLCVVASVVANIVRGHIASILGYLVSIIFLALTWILVRISYKEMREYNKK